MEVKREMCRYMGNDFILGKLFEKVAEKEINNITFSQLYDILYYTSVKLNRTEETVLLVTRDGILNFAEMYNDFITIDESSDKIIITNKEKISTFSAIFDRDDNLDKVISYAIEQACAA